MANIDPYIKEIQNAQYGEEVRSSIVNALVKVNDDNESYQKLKEEKIADYSEKEYIETVWGIGYRWKK